MKNKLQMDEEEVDSLCRYVKEMRDHNFDRHLEEYRRLIRIAAGLKTDGKQLNDMGLMMLMYIQQLLTRDVPPDIAL